MFSRPRFLSGLTGDALPDLWTTLSSILEPNESSSGWALPFPVDSGVTTLCGRVSLTGLSSTGVLLSFSALSKAEGRSFAPGIVVFLLGLPWGVAGGSRKSCLGSRFIGVVGRGAASASGLFPPPDSRFAMKLAMAAMMLKLLFGWAPSTRAFLKGYNSWVCGAGATHGAAAFPRYLPADDGYPSWLMEQRAPVTRRDRGEAVR